jgi:cytochrome c peroxidase
VLSLGTMPPLAYSAMHWEAWLDEEIRQQHHLWVRHRRARLDGAQDEDDPIYSRTVYPLVQPRGLDPAQVAIGKELYHDARLSTDDTLSCASCHDLARGGTDQAQVSTGVGGQLGGINAPTVLNARYGLAQFWDGRAADLVEQADGPPLNPVEMGSSWEEILGKLRQDEPLVAAMERSFGELTETTVKQAIATFEETLVTTGSRFDSYLQGDPDALSAQEGDGWLLFTSLGCDTCHVGPALGGTSFERLGVFEDYFARRGGELTEADLGRFNVTGDAYDRHRFKVPTLRNIELTFPYFHDGSVEDLPGAVRLMAICQRGVTPTAPEISAIVDFLETLTGQLDGKRLR